MKPCYVGMWQYRDRFYIDNNKACRDGEPFMMEEIRLIENNNLNIDNLQTNNPKILNQQDLYELFPFGKTKIQKLIKSGELPLLKIGNDYITTFAIIEGWIKDHAGEEIYY